MTTRTLTRTLTLTLTLTKALVTGGWGHYDYPTPVDHPRPIELFGFVAGKLCFLMTLVAPLLLCDTWGIGFRQVSPNPDPNPNPNPHHNLNPNPNSNPNPNPSPNPNPICLPPRQMFLMVYIGSFFVILTFAVSRQANQP